MYIRLDCMTTSREHAEIALLQVTIPSAFCIRETDSKSIVYVSFWYDERETAGVSEVLEQCATGRLEFIDKCTLITELPSDSAN